MLLTEKADMSDIIRLQALSEELERRLVQLLQETTDRFGGMDAKLDRRSDRIVTWCLKQLRKEMRALSGQADGADTKDDTDIGRIRCLVCNHVSTQQKQTDVVHSGPGITMTLKHHHRSPSPPRSPETNTYPAQTVGGTGFQAAMAATNAHTVNPASNNATHSRLVKLGSSPEPKGHNQEAAYLATQQEDPDFIADFKYRNHQATMPSPVTLPHTTTQHAQSAPLIQIISHHPTDNTHVRLNQLPFHQQTAQQEVLNYYKELEQYVIYFLILFFKLFITNHCLS